VLLFFIGEGSYRNKMRAYGNTCGVVQRVRTPKKYWTPFESYEPTDESKLEETAEGKALPPLRQGPRDETLFGEEWEGAPLNVFIYTRVSGKSQVEGDGFERQEAAAEAFCKQHGMIALRLFREEGVSGTVEGFDRPVFRDMIQEIDNRSDVESIAIVVERMDRLARDLMVSEVLLAECRRRGIKVFSADQGALIDMAADGADPTRTLIRQIMGALAQWEKSMLVNKLRVARQRTKEKTGRCEGQKPYGEKVGEAANLLLMKEWAETGISCLNIAGMLNAAGEKSRSGNDWTPSAVRLILSRRNIKAKLQ